jgi:hypothetical protein
MYRFVTLQSGAHDTVLCPDPILRREPQSDHDLCVVCIDRKWPQPAYIAVDHATPIFGRIERVHQSKATATKRFIFQVDVEDSKEIPSVDLKRVKTNEFFKILKEIPRDDLYRHVVLTSSWYAVNDPSKWKELALLSCTSKCPMQRELIQRLVGKAWSPELRQQLVKDYPNMRFRIYDTDEGVQSVHSVLISNNLDIYLVANRIQDVDLHSYHQ